jgi:predicted XRE-type DNA-binding protein
MTIQEIIETFDVSQRQIAETLDIPRGRVALLASGQASPTKLEQFALDGLAAALRSNELNMRTARRRSSGKPVDALALSLEGDKWSSVTARLALPWLASNPKPTTYGEVHAAVVACGGKSEVGTLTKYGYPLGAINDAMQEASRRLGKAVPPLAALVCNKVTRVPTAGINPYLKDYLNETGRPELARRITRDKDAPQEIIDLIHQEIAEFGDWDEVVRAVGLTGDPADDI